MAGVRLKVSMAALVVAFAATGLAAAPSANARKRPVVRPTQELAMLLTSHRVLSSLRGRRRSRATRVGAWRPITATQTVLPVLGRATTADGVRWLRVRIPGRPNGTRGWISRRRTVLTRTSWHVVVKTASRRVLVYRRGRLARSFGAIVGKRSTPTPRGRFFVEESVRMLPGSAGAPFALALSARSNVLQEFAGGPGQVALHGVGNIGGKIGTAVSHGCVRLTNRSIRWLAARIAPGVPVTIRR
ncbi:MAG: L,D-transpeptidase [Thermoleophilaceae bacterium]|nr:L,D-transpeptidase [Thermoleophilaceae bacterium]